MAEALHILDRFVIHFTASTAAVLWGFLGLKSLFRRTKSEWLSASWRTSLLIAALAVFAGSTLREAYDVTNGQSLLKAGFDYASWLLGAGASCWSLNRFGKETR